MWRGRPKVESAASSRHGLAAGAHRLDVDAARKVKQDSVERRGFCSTSGRLGQLLGQGDQKTGSPLRETGFDVLRARRDSNPQPSDP
jgi:hypothetical protein